MRKTVGTNRPQMTIWRMKIESWKPKATNTHSQYAILIAFPQQQWLHEGATLLRCTYSDCIVIINNRARRTRYAEVGTVTKALKLWS